MTEYIIQEDVIDDCQTYKIDIISKLGVGSFGMVYKAIYQKQQVAVKIQSLKAIMRSETYLKRFKREIEINMLLKSENVVRMLENPIESSKNSYFFLEICNTGSLKDYMKLQGSQKLIDANEKQIPYSVDYYLNQSQAFDFLQQIVNGFQELHSHNIIHRDFKPDNVMVNFDEQTNLFTAQIADYGLSQVVGSSKDPHTQLIGTAITMAPEIMEKKQDYSLNADMFSLGCVFYYMLYGQYPFMGQTYTDQLKKIISQEIDFRYPKIQPETEELVKQMLLYDPNKRMQWAQLNLKEKEFYQDMEQSEIRLSIFRKAQDLQEKFIEKKQNDDEEDSEFENSFLNKSGVIKEESSFIYNEVEESKQSITNTEKALLYFKIEKFEDEKAYLEQKWPMLQLVLGDEKEEKLDENQLSSSQMKIKSGGLNLIYSISSSLHSDLQNEKSYQLFVDSETNQQYVLILTSIKKSNYFIEKIVLNQHITSNTLIKFEKLQKVYDIVRIQDKLAVLIQFIQGQSMYDMLKENSQNAGVIPPKLCFNELSCISIFLQVLRIMMSFHRESIVYRDITAKNIIINDKGEVHVLSSLSARQIKSKKGENIYEAPVIELMMRMVGDPYFRAPQIESAIPYGCLCDIFSMGTLLFVMLYEEFPFIKHTQTKIFLDQDLIVGPQFIDSKRKIPIELQLLIMDLLQFQPEQRIVWMDILKHNLFAKFKDFNNKLREIFGFKYENELDLLYNDLEVMYFVNFGLRTTFFKGQLLASSDFKYKEPVFSEIIPQNSGFLAGTKKKRFSKSDNIVSFIKFHYYTTILTIYFLKYFIRHLKPFIFIKDCYPVEKIDCNESLVIVRDEQQYSQYHLYSENLINYEKHQIQQSFEEYFYF